MIVFPNAKINLGLNIIEKRSDGFHNIESCFYPVGWADALEIIPAEAFSFTSSGIDIPGDPASNLCVRAYELLKADFDLPPVKIHLHKVVPIGAGMGGGSSDCAFTFKLLNELFELGLTSVQMQEYAAKLGSDCPFFIDNKPVWVTGRGEVFEAINLDLSGKYIVLAYPNLHVSTGEAYAGITPQIPQLNAKQVLENEPYDLWKDKLKNDFEDSILVKYKQVADLKEYFYLKGAFYASMTGSGSAVFGIFEEDPNVYLGEGITSWQGVL
ncbi:4-(cytidine 5'-diphospho)-2-C-methyl-D-erythritol kinase [Limibacter armeniacum]|uniref:4-(cytidine 5'-diphospho)-2-C-methyl-D-erythritol kinase n=1 Tax=Limibacter armeniacum TaxID=466084 RepID=UPI002FE57415